MLDLMPTDLTTEFLLLWGWPLTEVAIVLSYMGASHKLASNLMNVNCCDHSRPGMSQYFITSALFAYNMIQVHLSTQPRAVQCCACRTSDSQRTPRPGLSARPSKLLLLTVKATPTASPSTNPNKLQRGTHLMHRCFSPCRLYKHQTDFEVELLSKVSYRIPFTHVDTDCTSVS